MKPDLTARLREIIKQPLGRSEPVRDLTLEPTLEMRSGLFSAAERAEKSAELVAKFGGVFA